MIEALSRVEDQLKGLREEVAARPTKSEVNGMRRLAVFGVVTLIVFVVQVTDIHTEACGPGHRAEAVVELIRDSIAEGERITPDQISDTIENATPGWVCGLTFPSHAHDGHSWPERQHIIGIVLYLAFLFGLLAWAWRGFDPKQNKEKN